MEFESLPEDVQRKIFGTCCRSLYPTGFLDSDKWKVQPTLRLVCRSWCELMYDVITEIPHEPTLRYADGRLRKYVALKCLHLRVDTLDQPLLDDLGPLTLANLRRLHIHWDGDVTEAVAAAVGTLHNLTSLVLVHEIPLIWNRHQYSSNHSLPAIPGSYIDLLHLSLLPLLAHSLEELTVRGDWEDAAPPHGFEGLRVQAVAAVRACTRLTRLTLVDTRFCSDALVGMVGNPQLRRLEIDCRNMAEAAFCTAARHWGKLASLTVSNVRFASSFAFRRALGSLTTLRHLDITTRGHPFAVGAFDSKTFQVLSTMRSLESLELRYCQGLDDIALQCLAALTALTSLTLFTCLSVTSSGFAKFAKASAATKLTKLVLNNSEVSREGIAAAGRKWPQLLSLDLSLCKLEEESLPGLRAFTALTSLNLNLQNLRTCRHRSAAGSALARYKGGEIIADGDLATLPSLPQLKVLLLPKFERFLHAAEVMACFARLPALRWARVSDHVGISKEDLFAQFPQLSLLPLQSSTW